ncbi:oligosaccharide flippase family protein [Aquisalimonas lutea]|uniref:lipopolysaccharide biosynthesis protein n=1 Tax=Aquisalimonas lutea TaxID=1327750 RepID=UPI0025B480B0|nr:oligosaccharide flippase family protein [Aquisalimonas lutea]MDN3517822.1 oligosaccharide flippase family protein [Aquisalimonas lutea]
MSEARTLGVNGLIYLAATLVARGVPFILMVVYANVLPPDEYGLVGTIMVTVGIVSVYVGLRPDIYVIKHYHQDEGAFGDHIAALYQILATTFLVIIALLVLGHALLPVPREVALGFAAAVAVLSLGRGLQLIPDSLLMSSGRSLQYAISQLVLAVGYLAVSLPLVYWLRSWEAMAVGNFVVWCAGAGVSTALAAGLFGFHGLRSLARLRPQRLREAFGFLFPLTFHVIGFALVNAIDRFILMDMQGVAAVGAYTAAYTLGLVLGVAHDALLKAWNPYFFRRVTSEGVSLRRMLAPQSLYALASVVSALVYGYAASHAFEFMYPAAYANAAAVVPVVCLAYGLEGVRKIFCGQLYVFSRMKTLASMSLLAALANIVLNVLWIPQFGIMGAAYATLAAFAFMATAVIFFSIYLSHAAARLPDPSQASGAPAGDA